MNEKIRNIDKILHFYYYLQFYKCISIVEFNFANWYCLKFGDVFKNKRAAMHKCTDEFCTTIIFYKDLTK